MADKPNRKTSLEVNRIMERISSEKEDFFHYSTEDLTKDDFYLIGRVVQQYCFVDLNARRLIDLLRHAALGPESRNGAGLQDGQVLPQLIAAASKLPTSNLQEGIIRAARSMENYRDHRHHFAHWAARRIVGHNLWIMLNSNSKEIKRRIGIEGNVGELTYGIIHVEYIIEDEKIIEGHSNYLAQAVHHVAAHFDRIQHDFSKSKKRREKS